MTTGILFDIALTVSGDTHADSTVGEGYWLRLTQDPPPEPEKISRVQLATEIDKIFGTENHCTGEKTADAFDPGEQTAEQYIQGKLSGQGCQDFATALNLSQNCALEKRLGNPLIKNIYAHCSSKVLREDYTLRPTGSAIVLSGPNPGSGIIRVEIDFSKASFAPVNYYAENIDITALWRQEKYSPAWVGPVLSGITKINPPAVSWSTTGTVLVDQEVSGKLIVYLPIKYDRWTVSIPGTVVGDRRDYNARFIGSSQFLDSPAEITLEDETDEDPQSDDCSLCGGAVAAVDPADFSGITPGPAPADPEGIDKKEWPTATGCCDGEEIEYTPRQEGIFTGFQDLPEEDVKAYQQRYGEDTIFIGVGPTEPPCGDRIETQEVEDCRECEGVSKLVYPDNNPDIVAIGGSVLLTVEGGKSEIEWSIKAGRGFSFANGQTSITSGREVILYAGASSCGTATIQAEDGCSIVLGGVSSLGGVWSLEYEGGVGDGQYVVTCTETKDRGDGIQERYYYINDWCMDSELNCEGSEAQDCSPPESELQPIRVEYRKVYKWGCP